jgi:hypothetical protein
MSELKVNSIKSLDTNGVRIDSPVGINTTPPSKGLNVSGRVSVIDNGLEVVTVVSENYGVKIKAPPSNKNSVLQFTENDGAAERAFIAANSNNDLIFNTGATAAIITGAGLFDCLYESVFRGNTTFQSTSQFQGQATFDSNVIPKTAGVPSADEDLVNLAYIKSILFSPTIVKTFSTFGGLSNAGQGGCCTYYPGVLNIGSLNETLVGKWAVIAFSFGVRSCSCYDNEQFHFPIDDSKVFFVENKSIRDTISDNSYFGSVYNVFGFAVKVGV